LRKIYSSKLSIDIGLLKDNRRTTKT